MFVDITCSSGILACCVADILVGGRQEQGPSPYARRLENLHTADRNVYATGSLQLPPIGIDAQLVKQEGINIRLQRDSLLERRANAMPGAGSAAEQNRQV